MGKKFHYLLIFSSTNCFASGVIFSDKISFKKFPV
jgi:hypothetical protein